MVLAQGMVTIDQTSAGFDLDAMLGGLQGINHAENIGSRTPANNLRILPQRPADPLGTSRPYLTCGPTGGERKLEGRKAIGVTSPHKLSSSLVFISACIIIFHLILSYLISSQLILSYLILSHLLLFHILLLQAYLI